MNCPTCQAKIKNTRYKVREPYVPKRPCSSKIFKHTKKNLGRNIKHPMFSKIEKQKLKCMVKKLAKLIRKSHLIREKIRLRQIVL